jgi:tRNA nucleotidyltransferase (CCA-adding enzyme)
LPLLPDDGRPDLLLLACLLSPPTSGGDAAHEQSSFALLDAFEFPAGDRDRALAAARLAPRLSRSLHASEPPSRLRAAVAGAPVEAVALAASLDERAAPGRATAARRWLEELRHVRLRISGDDLLAAGIPEGPQIGGRLAATLDMRLDGKLEDTREAQLKAALERQP